MTRIVNLATANTKLLEDSSQLLQISSAPLREIQIRLCCKTRRDTALGIKIPPGIVELVFPSKNRRTLKDRPREFHDEKIAALALPISPGARSESIYQAFEEEDVAFLTLRDTNCSRSNVPSCSAPSKYALLIRYPRVTQTTRRSLFDSAGGGGRKYRERSLLRDTPKKGSGLDARDREAEALSTLPRPPSPDGS